MDYRVIGVGVCGLITAGAGQAQDLFVFRATPLNGDPPIIVSTSSLPDSINDLADQEATFAALDGLAFNATLNYASIENAVVVNFDPNGGGVGVETLNISLVGVNVPIPTFVDGANGEDLGTQLEDFFLVDNPDIIASFQNTLNELTPVAVGDGNPIAVTARSAGYKFNRFGMFQDGTPTSYVVDRRFTDRTGGIQASVLGGSLDDLSLGNRSFVNRSLASTRLADFGGAVAGRGLSVGGDSGSVSSSGGRFAGSTVSSGRAAQDQGGADYSVGWFRTRLDLGGSAFEAGPFSGYDVSAAASFETSYSESFSLVLGLPFAYHEIEGAEVYNAGVHLDAPIRLIKPQPFTSTAMGWQITPGASADIGASYDLAAGGIVWSYGVTNLFSFYFGDFELAIPTGFYLYDSIPLETADISFDSGVEQDIFKQGAKLTYAPGGRFQVFGGITFTDFLGAAAVDQYWTPTAGIGWTFYNGGTINIAYEGDFDTQDTFERHGARLNITIPF